MRTALSLILAFSAPGLPQSTPGSLDSSPLMVVVESSLGTSSRQIRQFAFDGDPETYFASAANPDTSDHFTLILDRPVVMSSIEVITGKLDGSERLDFGCLQVSKEGLVFDEVDRFRDGVARFHPSAGPIKAIRIRPLKHSNHPLVIREIAFNSTEPVARFAYPIEFIVDVADAPEMKEWAEKAAKLCERWYPRINEELKSNGFRPASQIRMTFKRDYEGVAEASGNRIKGSVDFFKEHPDDFGAMIHETCHVVQGYHGQGNPGWLVEGVADYVRFFVFEPRKAGPIDPAQASYDASYRTTAAFLAFVSEKYDKRLVLKLNQLMREGKFDEEAFRTLTGKAVRELGEEWRRSLSP